MHRLLLTTALLFPMAAFAVGSNHDTSPPKPSPTSEVCEGNKVWDSKKEKCVKSDDKNALNDDQRYDAVRELAYQGQYDRALQVLTAMSNQADDRVLTYRGFIARKTGDLELGNAYYAQAISANPDNLLARSYMAQGFVAAGKIDAAKLQLAEIRARGGKGTWPEFALKQALSSGKTYSY